MLRKKKVQVGETAAGEAVQVATDVGFFGGPSDRRQAWRLLEHSRGVEGRFGRGPAVLLDAHPLDLARDAWFVLLQDLADALVELDAVTIEWNMAAAHHHAGASGGDGVRDQCGRGDLACVLHLAAQVDNRLGAGTHDAVGARPEVAGDDHSAARMNITNAQQIPERSFDIDIGLEVGNVFDQAAQSAGAKGQRNRRVIEERSRGAYSQFGHCSYVIASLAFKPARIPMAI